ncbi:MAG TPA: hypothetical protein VFB75_00600 [Burkholderiales bacterium]|nr:hypothetical protein [Burkholderiales bacterium]
MAEERRNHWNFENTDTGWTWTVSRADGSREASTRAFRTLKECADDAISHGYVAWRAEEERRRDLVLGVKKALKRDVAQD